jgi:hypothetical protein
MPHMLVLRTFLQPRGAQSPSCPFTGSASAPSVHARVHQDMQTAIFNQEIEDAIGLCPHYIDVTCGLLLNVFNDDTFCLEAYFLCS